MSHLPEISCTSTGVLMTLVYISEMAMDVDTFRWVIDLFDILFDRFNVRWGVYKWKQLLLYYSLKNIYSYQLIISIYFVPSLSKWKYHCGPTDVEDDRPPHPMMARAVSASGLYGSIVTFHAVKCWIYAWELTNYVHMNSWACCCMRNSAHPVILGTLK